MTEEVTWYVGKGRLLKLIALLKELPRRRFDYQEWVGPNWKGKKDLSCGAPACALGWATTIPSIQRAGLYLSSGGMVEMRGDDFSDPFEAARKVFGLWDRYEARFLFSPNEQLEGWDWRWRSPGENATAKEVARHIEKFIREKDLKLQDACKWIERKE
jgi:hypothetical protein